MRFFSPGVRDGAVDLLGLLPWRYVNVAAEVTYNDDLPDALSAPMPGCVVWWQDTLQTTTHLPQFEPGGPGDSCHRQAHAMSLHLRQLRSLGLISYVGNKNGYPIHILDPTGRANIVSNRAKFCLNEQNFASTEQISSPMLNAVAVDQLHYGARAQQQQQQQAEQNFALTGKRLS